MAQKKKTLKPEFLMEKKSVDIDYISLALSGIEGYTLIPYEKAENNHTVEIILKNGKPVQVDGKVVCKYKV